MLLYVILQDIDIIVVNLKDLGLLSFDFFRKINGFVLWKFGLEIVDNIFLEVGILVVT